MKMPSCEHEWEMTNIQFGFIVFEKCSHCDKLRTYFSTMVVGEDYSEGDCLWKVMENAQSFRFDLKCKKCNHLEKYEDIMGFMYCTGCLEDCQVEILQKKYAPDKTWVMVAFGFLTDNVPKPISGERLKILDEYFNQRRDTTRSRMKILSYDLIENFTYCKGEFMFDIGMLSAEPPIERKPLF
jgi:hypothetical protein